MKDAFGRERHSFTNPAAERKEIAKRLADRKREDDAAAWAAGLTNEELTAWWANEVATLNTNPSAKLFAQRGAAIIEMRARDLY